MDLSRFFPSFLLGTTHLLERLMPCVKGDVPNGDALFYTRIIVLRSYVLRSIVVASVLMDMSVKRSLKVRLSLIYSYEGVTTLS